MIYFVILIGILWMYSLYDILHGTKVDPKDYSVRVLLHSRCEETGAEVYTWEQVHPLMIHAEFMTHRVMSRNTSSMRAIPTKKILAQVIKYPAYPVFWGKNQPGMQAKAQLSGLSLVLVKGLWGVARYGMVFAAWILYKLGLHKQLASRLIHPWAWATVLVTATELDNYLDLRDHPDAQPEIAVVAKKLRKAIAESKPQILHVGEWHIPFSEDPQKQIEIQLQVSAGRCARVSYNNHNGARASESEDIGLAQKLLASKHMSPLEHQCQALGPGDTALGNLKGWAQYRHHLSVFSNETLDKTQGPT